MNDPTFLLLLGGMIGIIFQWLFKSISESITKAEMGLYFALLLLFLANAFVLVGEILIFPPIRSQLPGLIFIFLLALAIFILAIYSLRKKSKFIESNLIIPISFLIFGNLVWGVSEVVELILIELGASGDPGSVSRYIRIIIAAVGVGCFLIGAYKIKKHVQFK